MKIIKNQTEYTVKIGMGDVLIGHIIDYDGYKCVFRQIKDKGADLDSSQLKTLNKKMEELESEYKIDAVYTTDETEAKN